MSEPRRPRRSFVADALGKPRFVAQTLRRTLFVVPALVVSALVGGALAGSALLGCGARSTHAGPRTVSALREAARGSEDTATLGEWLLGELLLPGGEPARAGEARRALARHRAPGLRASLGSAIESDVHGRYAEAVPSYLALLEAARLGAGQEGELFAWFAAGRLEALRPAVAGAWKLAEPVVARAIAEPMGLGWRARASLVEWWAREAQRSATDGGGLVERVANEHGCLKTAEFAGPFGTGAPGDVRVAFEPEAPGVWPAQFAPGLRSERPTRRKAQRHGCALTPEGSAPRGVYYVQTFFDLDAPTDVVLAVAGAGSVLVDDVQVLERDEAKFGSFVRLGAAMRLGAGRHRVVARVGRPETSVRLLTRGGRPLGAPGSEDEAAGYSLIGPELLADPNPHAPFARALGLAPTPGGEAAKVSPLAEDPAARYVAAVLAAHEGNADVASVLLEPLCEGERPSAIALSQAALFAEADPIFEPATARTLARDLRERSAEADEGLWGPRAWLVLEKSTQARPSELARELEELSEKFPEVPALLTQLARIYAENGFSVEHARTVQRLGERFPEDVASLESLVEIAERQGKRAEADALARRVVELEPTSELGFRRALARRDYDAALAELRRIQALRADRRELGLRIADLLARAGKVSHDAVLDRIAVGLEKNPSDRAARLALADAHLARGHRNALEEALVEALETGSDPSALRDAIELLAGATALEPYRKDGLAVIRESREGGVVLPGNAARILDYAAFWVEADGSTRMLEHTVLRVQSREGIAKHTEQRLPPGMVLRLRTIKQDGRILEPEIVAGKPTATMPKLEVGDYIETESIATIAGDGTGRRFRAPRWFFREPNVSYHLSELVLVTPESRALDIETTGLVPAPTIERAGGLTVTRFAVRGQLALDEEPGAPPIDEFLPSVSVGWGMDWLDQLGQLAAGRSGGFPADPRLVRIARTIALGELAAGTGARSSAALASVSQDERARRIYRWVVDNVTPGPEEAPARIVTSKRGELVEAFLYLCRLAGVDARLAAVRSRLAPPPRGKMTAVESFASSAVRVATDSGPRWLVVKSRFAPYGYLPSHLAGQPAIVLDRPTLTTLVEPGPLERETTNRGGIEDGVAHRGKAKLARDGSAVLELEEEYSGRYAIVVRQKLSELAGAGEVEEKRRQLVEELIIGPKLAGAHVVSLVLKNLDALDEPLRMRLTVEVPNFAKLDDRGLMIEVPFLGSMSKMVSLPVRESPLYVPEGARSLVALAIHLPEGATLETTLAPFVVDEPRLSVFVRDRLEPGVVHVERAANIPAGRVQAEEYVGFRALLTDADRALNQRLSIRLATP